MEDRIKITNVSVRNVKRVSIASVPIDSQTTIVGGNNAQGKSSFLDAVAMALGGKRLVPSRPIKDGETTGEAVVQVEGCHPRLPGKNEITRTFTRRKDGGIKSELVIMDVESRTKANEPQTILNAMISASMFDPAAFLDQSEKKQFEHLREMVGCDTSKLDAERSKVYEERAGQNRKVKEADVKVKDTYVNPEDIPEEIDLTEMVARRDEMFGQAKQHGEWKSQLERVAEDADANRQRLADIAEQIKALRRETEEIEASSAKLSKSAHELKGNLDTIDMAEVERELHRTKQEIATAGETNTKRDQLLRKQELHTDMIAQLSSAKQRSQALTDQIEDIDRQKNEMLGAIEWPLDGLEFDFEHQTLLFQGVPLSQASSAEQLRVAVAIELAEDRPLPVMIIKNGSFLDEVNLAMIAKMVSEKGGQLFVERVGRGEECHVIFEDGVCEDVQNTATKG